MGDIDLSSLEPAEPRVLTQQAGRIAFELGYAGVFYHSRYGHSIENWAIFEDWTMPDRFPIHQPNSRKVGEKDPDLLEALRILRDVHAGERHACARPHGFQARAVMHKGLQS